MKWKNIEKLFKIDIETCFSFIEVGNRILIGFLFKLFYIYIYIYIFTYLVNWLCFFFESQKVTVHRKDKWRMGDGRKCNHPLTWGCHVYVICDLRMSFANKYLLHQLFSRGVILVGVSFWWVDNDWHDCCKPHEYNIFFAS